MSKQFEGKVAIVTGASAGIGKAVAIALAAEGAKVTLAARRAPECEAILRQITEQGGEARFLPTDMTQEDDVRRMVQQTVDAWGRLDYACNNAGILGTAHVKCADYTTEAWDQVVRINMTAVFWSMKYELPAMLASGGGSIVNMASVAGHIGGPGGVAYHATKHAVIGLTKTVALEYATQGIRVNAVSPAVIQTEMADRFIPPEARAAVRAQHPMGRYGTPEEVAQAVVWLCSNGSSFTTGHVLLADGGLVAH